MLSAHAKIFYRRKRKRTINKVPIRINLSLPSFISFIFVLSEEFYRS
jgi:hypothetical protein